MVAINYETDKQLIITVTLPDGRVISIDLKKSDNPSRSVEGDYLASGRM